MVAGFDDGWQYRGDFEKRAATVRVDDLAEVRYGRLRDEHGPLIASWVLNILADAGQLYALVRRRASYVAVAQDGRGVWQPLVTQPHRVRRWWADETYSVLACDLARALDDSLAADAARRLG